MRLLSFVDATKKRMNSWLLALCMVLGFLFLQVTSAYAITSDGTWQVSNTSDGKIHISGTCTIPKQTNPGISYDERYWMYGLNNTGGCLSQITWTVTWLNTDKTKFSFDFAFWAEETGKQTIWVNVIDITNGKYDQCARNTVVTATTANLVPSSSANKPGHLVYVLQPETNSIYYSVWTGYPNGGGLSDYRVMWSTDKTNWKYKILATRPNGTQSGQITGLAGGVKYYVKFQATNKAGTSESQIYEITPGLATAPQNPFVEIGSGSHIVTWQAPADLRGGTLVRYEISNDVSFSYKYATVAAGQPLKWTRTGLANGTITNQTYYIRAVTNRGNGAYCSVSTGNYYTGVPQRPAAPTVTLTRNSRSHTVKWTAPANNGSAITGYDIYRNGSKIESVGNITSKTYSMAASTDGTSVYYQVAAKNTYGAGKLSSNNAAVTLYQKPSAVSTTGAKVEPTKLSGQLKLTWVTPADNGGDITQVQIINGKNNATLATLNSSNPNTFTTAMKTPGQTATYTLTGLPNGTEVQPKIKVTNAFGTSTETVLGLGTPYTNPAAPASLTVTAPKGVNDGGKLVLTWPAATNNGNAVSKYHIYKVENGAYTEIANTANLTYTVTGLANDTSYSYAVKSENAAGLSSAYSPTGTGKTQTVPIAVDQPAVPQDGMKAESATVTWTALSGDDQTGRGTISKYIVSWEYLAAGNDPNVTPPVTTTGSKEVGANETSTIVSGLKKGATYSFKVTAVNGAGSGPASAAKQVTLLDQTIAPNSVRAKKSMIPSSSEPGKELPVSGQIDVLWLAPDNIPTGCEPTSYKIYVYDSEGNLLTEKTKSIPVNATLENNKEDGYYKTIITGLINGNTYSVRVSAVNPYGESEQSTPTGQSSVVPVYYPGAPANVTADTNGIVETDRVNVNWQPANDNGSEILRYEVLLYSQTGLLLTTGVPDSNIINGVDTDTWQVQSGGKVVTATVEYIDGRRNGGRAVIKGLVSGREYKVGVRAYNEYGTDAIGGIGMTSQNVRTKSVPDAPTDVQGAPTKESGMVSFAWKAPGQDGGFPITKYKIEMFAINTDGSIGEDPYRVVEPTVEQLKDKFGELDYTKWITETPLEDGVTYRIFVSAYNQIGYGARSKGAELMPFRAPNAVESIKAQVESGTQMTVSWKDPSDDDTLGIHGNGGKDITGYEVRVYKVDSATKERTDVTASLSEMGDMLQDSISTTNTGKVIWVAKAGGDTESVTLKGLTPATIYIVDIRAVNDPEAGPSEYEGLSRATKTWWAPTQGDRMTVKSTHKGGQLLITWQEPADLGFDLEGEEYNKTSISKYIIKYRSTKNPNAAWIEVPVVEPKPVDGVYSETIGALENGAEYEFYVAAVNGAGETIYPGTVMTVKAIPYSVAGKPVIGTVETGNASALLSSITVPSYTGGSAIDSYNVYATELDKTTGKVIGEAELKRVVIAPSDSSITEMTDITIPDLENNKRYAITVTAVNATGLDGEASDAENVLVGLPMAPTNVSVEPGPRFTAVANYERANGNGSPILYYKAYVNGKEYGETFPDEQAIIETETGGADVSIEISAVNRVGESPRTAPVSITIGAPTTPRLEQVTAGKQAVQLSWSEATSNGITMSGYNVYLRSSDNDGDSWSAWKKLGAGNTTVADKVTSYTMQYDDAANPLVAGTLYEVKVTAVNLVGESPESETRNFRFGVPGTPTIQDIEFGQGELIVSFIEPNDKGVGQDGQPAQLTKFDIYANGVHKLECLLSGLSSTPDAEGRYYNADKTFWYTINNGTRTYYALLTGLANGSTYNVQVTASNYYGESVMSDAEHETPATISEAPRNIVAEPDYDKDAQQVTAKLTWKTPLYNGGSEITKYKVEVEQVIPGVGGADATYNPCTTAVVDMESNNALHAVVSGLEVGTDYRFKVSAVTKSGDGTPGYSEVITTFQKPGQPIIPSQEKGGWRSYYNPGIGKHNLEINWIAPDDGGTPITGYKVWVGSSCKSGEVLLPADTRSFTITGLNATSYSVRVEAFNELCNPASTRYGNGTVSEVAKCFVGKIAAPVITDVSTSINEAGEGSITLVWEPVNDDFAFYSIFDLSAIMEMNDCDLETAYQTASTSWIGALNGAATPVDPVENGQMVTTTTFEDREQKTFYYAMCCTTSQNMNGYMSNIVEVTLGGSSAPVVTSVTPGYESIALDFTAPTELNDFPLIGYQILLNGTPLKSDVVVTTPSGDPLAWDTSMDVITDKRVIDNADVSLIVKDIVGGKDYDVTVRAITYNGEHESYLPGIASNATKVTVWTNPGAPNMIEAIGGDGKFTARFRGSEGMGLPIAGYAVFHESNGMTTPIKVAPVGSFATEADGRTLNIVVTGIKNGYKDVENKAGYGYYVAAYTEKDGERWYSAKPEKLPTIVTGIPGAPEITRASAGNGTISIGYTEPPMDPSIAVNSYIISYNVVGSSEVKSETTTGTTYTIKNVTNSTVYNVSVRAVNSIGEGPASEPIEVIPGTPSAPEILDYASADQQITVRWRTPADNGRRLESYRVYYTDTRDDSRYFKNVDVNLNSITLDGLVNGVEYIIEVAAFNSNGEGNPSQALTLMPGTVPGEPVNVTAEAQENGQIKLSWREPISDGGLAIDYYKVTGSGTIADTEDGIIAADDENNYTVVTENGKEYRKYSVAISELKPGTSYRFGVVAHNRRDFGDEVLSNEVTTFQVPGMPNWRSVASSGLTFTLKWTPPTDNGGTPIIGYVVYVDGKKVNEQDADGNDILLTISETGGLAIDEKGIISYTAPNPLPDGTNLILGEVYEVSVAAVNAMGEGAGNSVMEVTIQAPSAESVPGRPGTPTVKAGNAQLTVEWTAPLLEGVSEGIDGYTVYYREKAAEGADYNEAASIWHTKDELREVITGLKNGVDYEVWVVAKNRVGDSPVSTIVTARPIQLSGPTAPTNVTYQNNVQMTTMTVSWDAAKGNEESGQIYYDVYINRVGGKPDLITTNTYFQMSVVSGVKYKVWVEARNDGGTSGIDAERPNIIAMNSLNIETTGIIGNKPTLNLDRDCDGELDADQIPTKPTAPVMETPKVNGLQSVQLNWSVPVKEMTGEPFDDIDSYNIYVDGTLYDSIPAITDDGEDNVSILFSDKITDSETGEEKQGLEPGTIYVFQVSAVNGEGEGPLSTILQVFIQDSIDPSDLKATLGSGDNKYTSVKLEWRAPTPKDGRVPSRYWIQMNGREEWFVEKGANAAPPTQYVFQAPTVIPNNNYVFRVVAIYDETDEKSHYSNPAQISTALPVPSAPVDLKAEATSVDGATKTIDLTWNTSAGNEYSFYQLYVNNQVVNGSNGEPERIAKDATSYTYTTTNSGEFIFQLVAVNSASYRDTALDKDVEVLKEGVRSNTAFASTRAVSPEAPAAPINLAAEVNGTDITLTWDSVYQTVAGNNIPNDLAISYEVYVGIDGSEPEELSGELGDEYKDDIVVDGSTGKVSFVYSEPDSEGHDYIFRVLAILENGTTYEVRPVVEEDAVIDEEEVENYLLSAESDDVAVDTANGEQEKAPVAPVEGDNVTEDENPDADVTPDVKDDVTTDVPVVDETEQPSEQPGEEPSDEVIDTPTEDEPVVEEVEAPADAINNQTPMALTSPLAGPMSEPLAVSTKVLIPIPGKLDGLIATYNKDEGTITLTWNPAPADDEVTAYQIFSDGSSLGAEGRVENTLSADFDPTIPQYVYRLKDDKASYFFQVAAVNASSDTNSIGVKGMSELSAGVSVSTDGSEIILPVSASAPTIQKSIHSATEKVIRIYWKAPATDVNGNPLADYDISGYLINIAKLAEDGSTAERRVLEEKFNNTANYDAETGIWYYDIIIENPDFPIDMGTKYAVTISAWRSFEVEGESKDVMGAIDKPWVIMQNLNLDEDGDWVVDSNPDENGDGSADTTPGKLVTLNAKITAGGKADEEPEVSIVDQTGENISLEKYVFDPATGKLTAEFRIFAGEGDVIPTNAEGATAGTYNVKITKTNCTYFLLEDVPMTMAVSDIELPDVELFGGDINGDGMVDSSDYLILRNNYDSESEVGDINGDGVVDSSDYLLLRNNYDKEAITQKWSK